MTEDEQRRILELYRKALQSTVHREKELPGLDAFRGTMLVRADGTEYHYDDEWCRAEDARGMGERLRQFLDALDRLDVVSGDETEPDRMYVDAHAAAMALAMPNAITELARLELQLSEAEALATGCNMPDSNTTAESLEHDLEYIMDGDGEESYICIVCGGDPFKGSCSGRGGRIEEDDDE